MEDAHSAKVEAPRQGNRLAGETSPYLRSAAHQPVDWYPWGEEAFRRARELDRPVLLDVGAVWCHWCHVIDRESYDDPETARVINEHFVAVKVDRDERPDVDGRYQTAVQAISGQGGWPLTGFLTPEGKVFFGGTYFPPDDRYGRPGFRSVLHAVADFYRAQKARALAQAEQVHRALAEHLGAERRPGALSADLVEAGLNDIRYAYDVAHGGFGRQPKFFHPGALALFLRRFALTREEWMRTVVVSTLEKMARGGVYDQLGGGFHRYSVDDRWIVPHFEKMLYDNAALLSVYAEAARLTGVARFREVVDSIVAYYDREGSDRERGGFYGSQDADVGLDDDGDYFTWTVEEARAALDADEFAVLQLRYNIYARGEMHLDTSRNVLFVDAEPEAIARQLGRSEAEVKSRLATGTAKLLAARSARQAPYIDRSIFLSWNGLMVAAYLDVWASLGRRDCRDFAVKSLDRLLTEGRAADGGLYHLLTEDGRRKHPGLLDDQVQVAWAALRAYETTGEARFLAAAEQLADHVLARYWDAERGGCLDVVREAEPEVLEPLGTFGASLTGYADTPAPGANTVLGRLLVRLAHHTSAPGYREKAERTLQAYAGGAAGNGLMAPTYFLAVDELLDEPAHVVIVGPRGPETERLHLAALAARRPGTVVTVVHGGGAPGELGRLPAAVQGMLAAAVGPTAFVCAGSRCAPPVTDPEALAPAIEAAVGDAGRPLGGENR